MGDKLKEKEEDKYLMEELYTQPKACVLEIMADVNLI